MALDRKEGAYSQHRDAEASLPVNVDCAKGSAAVRHWRNRSERRFANQDDWYTVCYAST